LRATNPSAFHKVEEYISSGSTNIIEFMKNLVYIDYETYIYYKNMIKIKVPDRRNLLDFIPVNVGNGATDCTLSTDGYKLALGINYNIIIRGYCSFYLSWFNDFASSLFY